MAYEKAIRLLAHLECPQPPGMSDVKYLSLVDDVCRSKFTYVVASQVCRAVVDCCGLLHLPRGTTGTSSNHVFSEEPLGLEFPDCRFLLGMVFQLACNCPARLSHASTIASASLLLSPPCRCTHRTGTAAARRAAGWRVA